jgi:hypothetical protein
MTDNVMTIIFIAFMVLSVLYSQLSITDMNNKFRQRDEQITKLEKRIIVLETIFGVQQCQN